MTKERKDFSKALAKPVMSFWNKGYNKLIVAVVLVLTIVIGTGCSLLGGKVAATVNGKKIYLTEVDNQYKTYVNQLKQNKQPAPAKDQANNIKSMMLERLIRNEIIKQAAEKEGVKVSDKDVKKGVDQIKASTTKEQLQKGLKQMGWTEEDLADYVKGQIIETKLREKKSNGAKVSVKDAEEYYKQYKVNYKVPDQINVAIARVTKEADGNKIADEGDENFEQSAKKYSKAGYSPALPQGKDQLKFNYSEEFANVVFKLNKGEMTSVIKVNGGFAIAKAEGDMVPGYQKAFKDVKQEIMALLKNQKEQGNFEKYIEDFKKNAKIEIVVKELKPKQPQFPGQPSGAKK